MYKKDYPHPTMEVISLAKDDVICTSGDKSDNDMDFPDGK